MQNARKYWRRLKGDLIKDLLYNESYNEFLLNENQRLNNIIEELEKWLKIVENNTVMNEIELAYCNAYGNCLDKLKELKEGK